MRKPIPRKIVIMTILMFLTTLGIAFAGNQGPGQIYVFGSGPFPTVDNATAPSSNTSQGAFQGAPIGESPGAIYVFGTDAPGRLAENRGGFKMTANDKCTNITDSPGMVYIVGTGKDAAKIVLEGGYCG